MYKRNSLVDLYMAEKARRSKKEQKSLDWGVFYEAKPNEKAQKIILHLIDLTELKQKS